jgi:hypothetical protein
MFANGSDGLFAGLMVLRKDLFISTCSTVSSRHSSAKSSAWRRKTACKATPAGSSTPELDFLEVLSFERDGNSLFLQGSKHYQWKDGDLQARPGQAP